MYNNLIEEDIMILDNEFFKIDTMFETVDKMYDIKMKELEYNYIYTESINETYVDLYTETEETKGEKEQGLLGRLFTAILNFIRKIRAKILRFFGNDKKAAELEAKIKGNPKLANQTVQITNTADAEKAIDEGTSLFGSLIDKIVKGTATEADADAAEEKNKSLLSRIAIFGGGALLAAGGAKVANDKLHITEKLGNLFKRERETKKKADETTKQTEEMAKKGEDALKNNSQSGNEENTKAGRRIMGSFKGFITDVGKLFTGKVSELKSKINSSSSSNDEEERPKNTNTQQANDDTQQTEQKNLTPDEYYKKTIKSEKQKEFFKFKDENDKMIDEIKQYLVEISRETRLIGQNIISYYEFILNGSKRAKPPIPPSMTFEKIKTYNQKLKELLDKSKKEYEDLKSKNNTVSDSFAAATSYLSSIKKDSTKDEQEGQKNKTKIVNYPEFSDVTDDDKKKLITDASKAIKNIPQNSERGKREKESLEKIISKGISINSGDYNTLVNVVRNEDISKKYKQFNDKKNEQQKNDIEIDTEQATIRCKDIIRQIKTYDATNHVMTKDEIQKINEIDKKVTNKKCTENDLNTLQKIYDDIKKREPNTSNNSSIFNNSDDNEEPNSYCNRMIKEIETEPADEAKLTDDEEKQVNEIKDKLKNGKCTEADKKILDKISDQQYKRIKESRKNKQQTLTSQERPKNTNTQQASTPQKQEKDSVKDDEETQSNTKKNNKVREKTPQEKMDEEIENLMFKFHDYVYSHERPSVLLLNKLRIKKGYSIVSIEDLSKINFSVSHESKESHRIVERAKIFLDSYNIYSKYKNPDKNKVKEALKNLYDDDYNDDLLDEEMNGIKTTFTTLDKYAKELNELIKKRETFKESSYDLINDILTIFENSF